MLLALVLAALQLSSDPLVPRVAEIRLQVGATALVPVEVVENPQPPKLPDDFFVNEWDIPAGTLRLDRSGYELIQGAARIPLQFNAVRGHFRCADSEVAWFTSRDFCTQLKRVSLVTGRQLDAWNLPIDAGMSAEENCGFVDAALLDEGRLVVLFQERTRTLMPPDETTAHASGGSNSTHLFCLDARTGATLWKWTVAIPSTKSQGMPMPSLGVWKDSLVKFGGSWVVQASPESPLVAIDRATGAVRWQLERLWEFREPAIRDWRQGNYPCRFGERRFADVAVDDPELNEVRRPFDAARRGGAGLTSLVLAGEHKSDQPILLALAGTVDSRASIFDFPEPEVSIYGIGEDGSITEALPTPSLGHLGAGVSFGDRVVVLSQYGEILCLAKSSYKASQYFGHSAAPYFCFAWRREFRSSPPAARFVLESSYRPSSSLSRELAVLLGAWGRIESEDEQIARFPLSLVDPATGNARTAELVVPFYGSITPLDPELEFDGSIIDSGRAQWLGVTGVYVGHGRLRLTLSNGIGADGWTVSFALADVLAAR